MTAPGASSKRSTATAAAGRSSTTIAGTCSTEVWYDETDDVTPIRDLVFTYDTAGNMLTAVDPDAEYVFTYDTMNRLKTMAVDYPWSTTFDTFTLTYQYDAMGNVVSTTDSTGVAVKSEYDKRNRLESRWWEGDEVDNIRADFDYTAVGQLAHIDRWADKERTTSAGSTDYTYDLAGRVQEILHKNARRPSLWQATTTTTTSRACSRRKSSTTSPTSTTARPITATTSAAS